ncbi:thioredoxin [Clostridium homopropionicum DSM 5847]|uniref:Thioredoxin n=1 Tax=Clostridium homopropionicum DSM 5847 TaxID=1121318 RepID=A0A0L6ZBY7_9CLOT|nr:thioredoxin family protein [Clostridium homopropionicum]KOA20467.1 thioredoxin [Clostridium homopropionicum DSM 5847]SFG35897.1 Thioredoxin [Clostridium homopropionicum]
MERLKSIIEIDKFIQESKLAFLYISSNNCNVCEALMPKIQEVLEKYPKIIKKKIVIDDIQEVSGHLSIFTIPAIIFYIEGKEIFRRARFISVGEVEALIDRYYKLID